MNRYSVSRDPLAAPPVDDADVAAWTAALGLRTATLYPEPGVVAYLQRALIYGARCVKVHVQVGGFDPRDPLLDPGGGCWPTRACRSWCNDRPTTAGLARTAG